MTNTITFITDINEEVTLFENEFKAMTKDYITIALVDKEYPFELVTSDMIAEDITGTFCNHGLCEKAMDLIEGELLNLVNGTFWTVWIGEDCKWYYFINDFDKSQFKDGYVAYETKVINNVIIHDDYKHSRVGYLFTDVYKLGNFK